MESPKPNKKMSGVVEIFQKDVPASKATIAFNLIKAQYSDAIEYRGIMDGVRGLLIFLGLAMLAMAGMVVVDSISFSVNAKSFSVSSLIITIFAVGIFTPVGIFLFLWCVRLELFRPADEPIIFDRKNRKVYRIFREVQPGWRGLLKHWPLRSATYDWNLIDAEHHAVVNANTSTVSRMHSLVFIVRQSPTDATVVDAFTLGGSMLLGEVTVAPMYEHVRKFMEDGGPHLSPGEVLSNRENPVTFLQCMARMGPYGDTLKLWWAQAWVLTIIRFILFPISFPILTLLGIFSWFSYSTSIPIKWSDEVLAAVGPPVQFADQPSTEASLRGTGTAS